MHVTRSLPPLLSRPRFGNSAAIEADIRKELPFSHEDLRYIAKRLKVPGYNQPMDLGTLEDKIVESAKQNGQEAALLTVLKTTKAITGAFMSVTQMKMALQFGDLNDIVMEQFSSGGGTTVRAALPIAFEMAMKPERREAITNALRAENQGNQDLKQALTTFNATLPLENTEY